MQEQQNHEFSKEIDALTMRSREKNQELNLIEHQIKGLQGNVQAGGMASHRFNDYAGSPPAY